MKFGVVGLGNHSLNRVMPAIGATGHDIRSIYSSDKEKGERVSSEYGAEYYADLGKMLSSDMDAVYIGSPNFLHYTQAKAALESGKHVLLEKQMTLDITDAEDLVAVSERTGLKLAIGFHMRSHPVIEKIRKLVSSGEIGEPVTASGTWGGPPSSPHTSESRKWWREDDKVGGGSIMGTGVHVLDSLIYVLGKSPERVSSVKFPSGVVIETTQQVNLIYPDMAATAVSSRKMINPDNSLHISGSKGTIAGLGIFGVGINGSLVVNGKTVETYSGGSPYEGEIKSFVSLVNGKESNIASGTDGARIVRIVNAANESASTGMEIRC